MALLSYLLALLESRQKRRQGRINRGAVAHLSDQQLRDIGLYRVDDHVRPMADPLAMEAELKRKQEAALKALREQVNQKSAHFSQLEESN